MIVLLHTQKALLLLLFLDDEDDLFDADNCYSTVHFASIIGLQAVSTTSSLEPRSLWSARSLIELLDVDFPMKG